MVILLAAMALVLEPLRWLHRWFLRRASVPQRNAQQARGRVPPLADMVWLEASPALRILQYYSTLAAGLSPRLRILWARSYNSFDDFCNNEPDVLAAFRRGLECAVAWVHYRLVRLTMCTPFLWCSLIDDRRSPEDRASVKSQLWRLGADQGDSWFHQVLIKMLGEESRMDDTDFLQALWLWAWSHFCTNAPSEFGHARDKQRVSQAHSWVNFVAHGYNQEASRKIVTQQKMLAIQGGHVGKRPPSALTLGGDAKPKRTRAKSLWDIVRDEVRLGSKGLGHRIDCTGGTMIKRAQARVKEIMTDPNPIIAAGYEAQVVAVNSKRGADPLVALQDRPEAAAVPPGRPNVKPLPPDRSHAAPVPPGRSATSMHSQPPRLAIGGIDTKVRRDLSGPADIDREGRVAMLPVHVRRSNTFPLTAACLKDHIGKKVDDGTMTGDSHAQIVKKKLPETKQICSQDTNHSFHSSERSAMAQDTCRTRGCPREARARPEVMHHTFRLAT